jgi:DNA replication initiation complex subunit (GINS family)
MDEQNRFSAKQAAQNFSDLSSTYEKVFLAIHSFIIDLEESQSKYSEQLDSLKALSEENKTYCVEKISTLQSSFRKLYYLIGISMGTSIIALFFTFLR